MSKTFRHILNFGPVILFQRLRASSAGTILLQFGLALIPLTGYGLAWVSHFFVEKNQPATFTYPLWSLAGDYRMVVSWLTGHIGEELERAGVNGS